MHKWKNEVSFVVALLWIVASRATDPFGAQISSWIHRAGCDTQHGKSCANGKFCSRKGATTPSTWSACIAACEADPACQAIAYRHTGPTFCHVCASSAWVGTYHDWGIYTKVHGVDLLDTGSGTSSYKSTINATIQAQRVEHTTAEGSKVDMTLAKRMNNVLEETDQTRHPTVKQFHFANDQAPANQAETKLLVDGMKSNETRKDDILADGQKYHERKYHESSEKFKSVELASTFNMVDGIKTHIPVSDGLVSWVMFGKVGSSTMRSILQRRSRAMKLASNENDKDASKRMNSLIKNSDLCFWGHEYQPELINPKTLPCASQPDGAVILSLYHGYCDMLGGARPCREMTLLRDPIDRLISEYSYFCQSCSEQRLRCKLHSGEQEDWEKHHPGQPMPPLCPNISLIEWAKRHDNPYTRRFSKLDSHDLMRRAWTNAGHQFDVGMLHAKSALQSLMSPNMLVLFLEDFDEGLPGQPTGLERLSSFLKIDLPPKLTTLNLNTAKNQKYKPTLHEFYQLRDIMRYDVQLYEGLRLGKVSYK